ncbi:hypothetical protein DPM19_19660 [Actinomadura craniellae]|uniref:Peptidase S8/S53 domain-containing protein n=1 Tax=Actinomadura craniellae TaxID=2231787 RepID=A0A365H2H5_9ACTN|nr:S8 family serine peptidase [Actinomadura craniellae]RAY13304.1 hypothetical protein DPM19_19660 [Actinomadura craniellae]
MLIRRPSALLATVALALLAPLAFPVPAARADSTGWDDRLARDFRDAHQTTRGGRVTVAILSTGVDAGFVARRDAVRKGRDFVGTPRPKKIEGSLLAGLLAGRGLGLAPEVKILPVRVHMDWEEPGAQRWESRNDSRQTTADGIRYAADQGAGVIVVGPHFWDDSYGGPLGPAVAYALAKNAVVVAGNGRVEGPESHGNRPFPAAMTGVVGVGAVDTKGRPYRKYSQPGSGVLVAAPGGEHIIFRPGGFWRYEGTSVATAWAGAAAALVRSAYPRFTPAQVATALARSARHPAGAGRYDTNLGFGIVNPAGALREARKMAENPLPLGPPPGSVPDASRFAGRPEPIEAVRHSAGELAGFSALAGAGVLAMLAAVFVAVRGRRRAPVPAAGSPPVRRGPPWPAGDPVPEPPGPADARAGEAGESGDGSGTR